MGKMDEMIYAIEVDELFSGVNKFNKFIEMDTNILANIEEYTKIMKRSDCEENPTIKHLIPYIFLTTPTNKIFVTRRTSNQTESRLHNKASIGVGGHVGEFSDSMDIYNNVYFGAIRELNEELYGVEIETLMGDHLNLKLIGFVNYDADEVGQVHFGMVYHLLVNDILIPEISIKETENMMGEWMPIDASFMIDNYETWSRALLEGIWGK
jgi:predicted NUDIX family phosphoesterase